MEPRFGDPEGLAHHRDWEAGPLRCEENRGSLEDVALLFDAFHPFAKLTELIALRARQPIVAFSAIELVPLDPVMQRLIAATQALRYVSDAAAGEHQLHSLAAKLRRIRRSGSWHDGHPFASKPLKPLRGRQMGATPETYVRSPVGGGG